LTTKLPNRPSSLNLKIIESNHMKTKFNLLFVLILIASIGIQQAYSQVTETVAPNSMTVGITITAKPGSTKSVSEPYEISTESDASPTNEITLSVDTKTEPDNLMLNSSDNPTVQYSVSLYDAAGKLLLTKETLENKTVLPMASFPASTYFLKVLQGKNEIRTFRIIKN
jgi:hypothetical protein